VSALSLLVGSGSDLVEAELAMCSGETLAKLAVLCAEFSDLLVSQFQAASKGAVAGAAIDAADWGSRVWSELLYLVS
jgi:hypothetical protein